MARLAFSRPLFPDYTSARSRHRARQDQPARSFDPLFHSLDDPVVHAGDRLHHLDALDAGGLLARRRSIGFRPARRDLPDLSDRDAGQLLYLALSARHYRRQYFILAQSHFHRGGIQLHSDRRPGRAHLLQHSAPHANCRAQQPPIADLDLQQFVLFHGRGLPLEPSGAKLAPPQRGTRSQARGTAGPAGIQRGHHSLHARRAAHDGLGGPHSLAEPHGRRNYGQPIPHGEGNCRCRRCGPLSGFRAI